MTVSLSMRDTAGVGAEGNAACGWRTHCDRMSLTAERS